MRVILKTAGQQLVDLDRACVLKGGSQRPSSAFLAVQWNISQGQLQVVAAFMGEDASERMTLAYNKICNVLESVGARQGFLDLSEYTVPITPEVMPLLGLGDGEVTAKSIDERFAALRRSHAAQPHTEALSSLAEACSRAGIDLLQQEVGHHRRAAERDMSGREMDGRGAQPDAGAPR